MSTDSAEKKSARGVLEFVSGARVNNKVKLRQDATIIGREKGDIIVKDTEISSTHCQIQLIDGNYHLFDMNSTNGTFVNGQRIVKCKLKPGDQITVGTTILKFELKDDAEVRNIATIFKSKKDLGDQPVSIVDTLIESELRSTSSANTIVLHITYKNGAQEEISLKQRVVFIGRASSFGHFDQDPEISRKHLLIKLNDNGEVFIEDQASTNGSKLNGSKISGMHIVKTADVVKVGGTEIKITTKVS